MPALFISFSRMETHPKNGIGYLTFTITYSSIHGNWSSLISCTETCRRMMVENTWAYIVYVVWSAVVVDCKHTARETGGLLAVDVSSPRYLSVFFPTRPELQTDSNATKTKFFAQTILQVALVGKVHSLGIIDEKDKGRRIDLRLCRIVDF